MNTTHTSISLRGIVIYLITALFLCYEMAVQTSPSVMVPQLMHDLNIDAATIGIMASCYFYSYTLMQIPVGLLFDRYRLVTLVSAALLLCIAGNVLFYAAPQVEGLAIARFLMGIGSAFAFVSVLVAAYQWFPSKHFALLVGIAQLLAAVGAMGGEWPLSHLINHVGWRNSLLWLSLIGACLLVLVLLIVRNHPNHKVITQKEKALSLKKSLGMILRQPQSWWIAGYAFSAWAPIAAFAELWGVPFLMTRFHLNTTAATWSCAMIWIGLAITSPILGNLSDRLGRRCILLKSCALIGVICATAILYTPHLSTPISWLLLFGIGMAAAGQILTFALVRDINAPQVIATAIGFNNVAVVLGGALLQPLIGYLLRWFWHGHYSHGIPYYSLHDYHVALAIVPFCFLFGLYCSHFKIKETYCKSPF